MPSSLSSPVINTHAHEWKCFRFRYFIGSDHSHDWSKLSLKVILKGAKSNESTQLFVADKVTNKGRYVQMPLPSNHSSVQVAVVQRKAQADNAYVHCN